MISLDKLYNKFNYLVFYLKDKKVVIIYLLLIFLFSCILYVFPVPIGLDNFRYISSTIFQGLASILAIVITLTLVSVQIFSQKYSIRLLKIFIGRKNYALWSLMVIYSFSIIYNLLAPYYVQNQPIYLMVAANIAIWLTIISLLVLFPYLIYTIRMLQPGEVLNILSKEINNDLIAKIVEFNKIPYISGDFTDVRELPLQNDPLIPIIEINVDAIKKNQINTSEESLTILGNIIYNLYINDIINEKNGYPVLDYFLGRLEVVKDVAMDYNDFKSFNKLIQIVFRMGFLISQKINDYSILIRFFEGIAESCTQKEFELIRLNLISYFRTLLNELINKFKIKETTHFYNIYSMKYTNLDVLIKNYKEHENVKHYYHIFDVLNYLNILWISSIENNLVNTEQNVKIVLDHVVIKFIKEGLFGLIKHETSFLRNMGVAMLEENPNVLNDILFILNLISEDLFKNWINIDKSKQQVSKVNNLIINVLESIKFIGYESLKRGNYDFKIGDYYDLEEIILLEDPILLKIVDYLKQISFLYLDKRISKSKLSKEEIEDVLMRILKYISIFGTDLAKNRSDSVKGVLNSLYSIVEHSNETSKVIKLKLGSETFYGMRGITEQCINYDSENVSDCINSLNQLRQWATDNNFNLIKSSTSKFLGKISILLTDKKILTEDLINLVNLLEKNVLNDIRKGNKNDAEESLKQLEVLAEEMSKKNFNDEELGIVFDPLDNIRKSLLLADMEDELKRLDNWYINYALFDSNKK